MLSHTQKKNKNTRPDWRMPLLGLLITLLVISPVIASTEVSAPPLNLISGQNLTFSLSLNGVTGAAGVSYTLLYNASIINITSIDKNTSVIGAHAIITANINNTNGSASVFITDIDPVYSTVVLSPFSDITIQSNGVSGRSDLSIDHARWTNAVNFTPLAFDTVTNGSVTVGSSFPLANFTANVTSGPAPLWVQFSDTSTGAPTNWEWTFGNGDAASGWANPLFRYLVPGNYSVSLNVTNANGSNNKTVPSLIHVSYATGPLPVPGFTINVTTGRSPLAVRFTDTSDGNDTFKWEWDFGDGSSRISMSSQGIPGNRMAPLDYTYTRAGNFSARLTTTNTSGVNTSAFTFINVYAVPCVEFSAISTSGSAPFTASFTDLSTGSPTGWAWFFGDENYTAPWTRMNASAGWTGRSGHSSVVLPDGSIVLMGGSNSTSRFNDTWRSTSMGATWTLMNASAGWSARSGHISTVMPDGSIILMGGDSGSVYQNDTWRSTDNGATWTLMNANSSWLARDLFCSVAMPDGSIILMGGEAGSTFKNDTWKSLDYGATWTMVNASGGWTARLGSTSTVMSDSSIVLMGGYDGSSILNDTWRSTDNGITWTRMNASEGWSARFVPGSVAVPDGTIILMGGYDGVSLLNDTWQSKDNGLTWALVNASAGWTGRAVTATGVLPDGSIVLLGGSPGTGLYVNDVWRFVPTGSSVQNASHTYTSLGNFQVSLQAYNAGGYNSTRKAGYINVSTGPSTGPVHNLNTSLNYSTIATAVSAATRGDTILVDSGVYKEYVTIFKQLTLRGADTGAGYPVVDAMNADTPLWIAADGVTIDSFTVMNGMWSTMSLGGGGIVIGSHDAVVSNITTRNNSAPGIYLKGDLFGVNNSLISHIHTANNTWCGIYAVNASFTTVTGINSTHNRGSGITIQNGTANRVFNSTFSANLNYGISLVNTTGALVTGNAVRTNIVAGIRLDNSTTNTIYNNYFNNTINAANSSAGNIWNSTKTAGSTINGGSWLGGNTWSDFSGVDTDGDGIGNTLVPYTAGGNITADGDWLPLTNRTGGVLSVANFTANVTSGNAPLPVLFTDSSTGSPTGWAWFFGDENYTQPWMRVNASAGWSARRGLTSVVMPDGSIVLMGGYDGSYKNDVWRSTDNGATWTLLNASAGWSGRQFHSSVLMPDGSVVLMGGYDGSYKNDVWRSTDNGATWTLLNASAGWSGRQSHASVSMPDGSIVLMGGDVLGAYKNDTWKSTDNGATWTLLNASAGWGKRRGHTSVSITDSSIILMGGDEGGYTNDVWRSTDTGVTWTQQTVSTGWSARSGHGSVTMPDGSVVLMGGHGSGGYTNDVWRSTDSGATWTQVNASAGWSGRQLHTSVSMPDGSIMLMGGSPGTGLYVNDVWRFVPTGSSVQNASHTYTSPGSFQVSLQAYNAGGYNSTRKAGYINVSSSPTTGSVHNQNTGLNYTTIPTAIDNATSGDIILIDSGTYFENVNISKPLTVRGNDTGTGLPIIDGRGNSGIVPYVSDCTIEQIRIRNATASWAGGIAPSMVLTANLTVRNTTITGSFSGIYLAEVNNSVISDVTVTNCTYGLLFSFVHKTNVDNVTFLGTTESVDGITLWTSTENVFSRTAVEGFPHYGINLDSDNNHNRFIATNVSDSLIGFSIAGNSYNTTIDQSYVVANTDQGIVFHNSNNNSVISTIIRNNGVRGIVLNSSFYNAVTNNTIRSNAGGLVLSNTSSNNTIYNNYFNNTENVRDPFGVNTWNITKTSGLTINGGSWLGGNYWSDYVGVDTDGDGIGNTLVPYTAGGNITTGGDRLPLTNRTGGVLSVANFTANITSGNAPLPVLFTDSSTGSPTGWAWFFGDENYTAPWMEVNESAGWSARYAHTSVTMPDGSIILMGGYDGSNKHDVWRSNDYGVTWIEVTASAGWSARHGPSSVELPDGSIILMGGTDGTYRNDTWRSTDKGATWTLLNANSGWSARYIFPSVVMPDGSIVLMGGGIFGGPYENDTWRSTDNGVTWAQQSASAGWSKRFGPASVAMPDGSIVLMGGLDGTYRNDTWRSTDNGVTWTLLNASSGWSGRFQHTSAVMPDSSILLMGGEDITGRKNDTWRSTDKGVTWMLVNASSGWSERNTHTSVAMPDGSIILMGGPEGAGRKNDVWRFIPTSSSLQNPSHTYTTSGNFTVALQAYNAVGYNSTRKINYITVTQTNQPPVVSNVTLTSTSGFNRTSDNLTLAWEVSDTDSNPVRNITNWYPNGKSLTVLNLPFEGGSNSTFTKDYSGFGNNGLVNGAIWNATDGLLGSGAYFFDGNDYINSASFNPADPHHVTLSVWMKTNQTPAPSYYNGYLVVKGNDDSANSYGLAFHASSMSNGFVLMAVYTGGLNGVRSPDGSIKANTWHHVAGVIDGQTMRLYLDGNLTDTDSFVGTISPSASQVWVGAQNRPSYNYYYKGLIDGAALYNRSLSAEQIKVLAQKRSDLLVSQELSAGDIWQGSVVPNDGTRDGTIVYSNELNITESLPIANFTATPTSGTAPLVVQFTDTSTNLPTNWNWSFGDGTYSTAQNTSHTFTPGIFSITLNVTNTQGSNISTRTAYIHSNFASPVMFRNTENRTGVYSDGGTRPGNSLKWNFTTGGDVHSSPVISRGVLYVGSSDGRLYALNASTGIEQWRYSFGAEVFSSPAVANGVVFVGTNDNNFYAFNATTGAKIWNFTTGNHIIGSPALADGTVFIGSADNTLYALNPTTGEILWDTAPGLYLDSSPTVSNGSVFIGSWDYRVYAFNATTGSGLWDYTTGNAIESSPAVENHTVFIGSDDHNLYALNAMTGVKIWNFTTGGYVYSSPAVSGGVVYVGSDDKNVYALNAVTGAKLWNFSALNAIRSSPAIANGVLYVGSHDGRLYALNATTGEKLWDYLTEEWTWVESSPAVSDGVVYFGGDTDNVYALHQIQPMANFSANVTSGTVPLSVRFTDTSTGSPSAWYWSFGDLVLDNISTLQHPVHTYGTTGNFTVSLNVTSSAGSNVTIKTGYITGFSPLTIGSVHNLNSGMNYTGIQLAVDNATAFDTILVDSGKYNESVNITRPLTLRGNETGTGPPVIDPGTPGVNTAITLSADNITLDGFVARNARAGVHITGSNATLRNITATQNDVGISLDSSRRNRITRAEVYNNTNDGITLVSSSDTTIDLSRVHANSGTGIIGEGSANLTLTNNVIDFHRGYGLYLKNSAGNTVSGNNLSTNDYGIALEHVKTSTFSQNFAGNNSGKGIYLDDTTGCVFTQNDAPQNGDVGINLYNTSRFNAFTENRATSNVNKGFYLDNSYNNTFSRDNASFNSNGFSLYRSNNNTFSGVNATYQPSGISLANSSGNTVSGGNILWNTIGGIGMEYAEENRFTGITLAGNNEGFFVGTLSNNNVFLSNTVINSTNQGITLYQHAGSVLSGNVIRKGSTGLKMDAAVHSSISNNEFVLNSDYGIIISTGGWNTFSANNASWNGIAGINIGNSTGNSFTGMKVDTNGYGVTHGDHSSNTTFSGNTVSNNSAYAFEIDRSSNVTIVDNTIRDNNRWYQGAIKFGESKTITITRNWLENNHEAGIRIAANSTTGSITNNTINGHTLAGIMVEYATSHEIFNNTLSGSDYGFKLDTARFNTISHNRVVRNSHGAALVNSSGNVFFDNAFNNTINVQDDGNNTWNTTKQAVTSIIGKPYRGGNFWSNYTGVDTNGDGIGTTLLPYNNVGGIAFGGDWLPLTNVTGILPPVAGFAANVTSGTAPLAIQFNDTSTGSPTSWNWSFGDGAGSSLQNPVHTYIAPGTYPVSLNATNDGGSNLSVTVNYVTAYPPRPVPVFSVNVTTGTAPLAVGFTDASLSSPTGWAWFFGDETFTEPWTSVNASAGWTRRWHHTSVVTPDGSIVLMGGMSTQLMNDTWRSTDNGSTWVLVNASPGWAPRYGHSSVVLPDGSIVLMGGYAGTSNYKNDVWRSTDKGSTWTLMNASAAWSVRRYFSSVAMPDGSILLTGGDYGVLKNDTWRSTDKGATWSLMNASSGWTQRAAHCSVAMTDSSIVVMGGTNAVNRLNDVWRSIDNGATWKRMNASAGWTPRDDFGSVAMPDSSIVVMGGQDGTFSLRNDVWRSTDNGTTWTQVNASAGWTARYGHCSVVTPGSGVMVLGGQDASTYKNDVWRFTPTGSSLTNPSHIYTLSGNFTVTLQAYNDGGSNRTQRTDYIRVSAPVTNGTVHNLNTTLSYQTITDGINNATGGDTLLVDSGTYHEQVDVNKRLSLRGNNTGAGLPVIDIGSPGVNTAILISSDNCSLDGFIAVNSRDGVHITGSNATARNVTVTQNHFGISLDSSSGNILAGITAFNNTYAGIMVSSSRNTTIRNSLVQNNTGIGISIESGSANTSVTGSIVRLNADYGIQVVDSVGSEIWDNDLGSNYYGITLVRSHDNRVVRNNASNSTENGIYLDSAVSNRLEENDAHDNRGTGIVFVNSSRNRISDNRVLHNTGPGIMAKENCSWNMLVGNNVSWNVGGAGGIYLETSGNNTISSSIIETNEEGIMLTVSSNNNTLSSNRFTNNTYNGIALEKSSNNTLMNNEFTRNGRGVHLSSSHNNTILSSVVHNATQAGIGIADNSTANTITDTSVDGTGQFGIYLVWSHGNTIMNLTSVARDYGIFTEFARNNTVQDSRISNSSTAGISLNASAGNLIADNYFNNTQNVQDNGNNTWNTTKQAATSIIGKPARGGNFWSNYAGVDTNGDGIGTTLLPYTNAGGIIFGGDWLPLTNVTGTLPPLANFTANVTVGVAPLSVQFNDTSTGSPMGWNWSFGDGSVSTVQHPVHMYLSSGTYTVSLNATNAGGSNVTTRTNYVTVNPPVPVPDFSANVTSGTAPLPVSFTGTASGSPTGWAWFFGDETFTQPWTPVNASTGWAARVYQSSAAMPDSSIILTGGLTHGGFTHDVWRSADGGNVWTEQTSSAGWSARDSHTSVAMPDGSIIVLGGEDTSGYKNDVWRSTDGGKVWTLMTLHAGWSPRIEHTSVAMSDGSILVMGGNTGTGFRNDVWRSTDNGATWIEQTSSAGWSARCGHTSVAMPDGSIVLLGGFSGGYVNDVWRSTDTGVTWTQQTASAGWSARSDHASVAMPDGSIVLMGGYLNRNDSWRSSDNGVTWTEISASAGWVGRIALSSVAMPDGSVLVMCGDDGAGNYKNDVWRLVPTGSIVQNPTHTYTSPGTYQVTLQAYNAYEFNSTRKAGYIHVTGSSAPVANFTANVTAGIAPLAVQFMDNSTGAPTGWNWSFGDGSVSAVQHPVHTYLSSGTYTVTLNATNAGGSSAITHTNYIMVISPPPVANFTANMTTGIAPVTVQFLDTSTESPTSWNWSFGDGTTSTQKNPVHTFGSGHYRVTLTVTNDGGSSQKTADDFVTAYAAYYVQSFTIPGLAASGTPQQITLNTTAFGGTVNVTGNVVTCIFPAGSGFQHMTLTLNPVNISVGTITGNLTWVEFQSTPLVATLSSMGVQSPGYTLNLSRIPHPSDTVGVWIIGNASAAQWTQYSAKAAEGGMLVGDVGYSLLIQTTILPATIQGANISAGVPITWANQYGNYSVKVMRISGAGTTSILDTVFAGYTGSNAQFYGWSPGGFSTFGIAGLKNVPPPPPSPDGGSDGPAPAPGPKQEEKPHQPVVVPVVIPPVVAPVVPPVAPSAPTVEPVEVEESFPMGFDGMSYNAVGDSTLDINLDAAQAAGATITSFPDRLELYQHNSPGVLITFWGDQFDYTSKRITGKVDRAEFATDPLVAGLSYGNVSGSIRAVLPALTQRVVINNTIRNIASPVVTRQFEDVLQKNNLTLDSVAFTMTVERVNLSSTGAANVTFTLPTTWIAAHGGKDAVWITRVSDKTGITELLQTVYIGTDPAGNMVFRGDSPNGSSLFGMVTAKATAIEQQEHPNVTYVPMSKPAMTTNVGMYAWLIGIIEENPIIIVIVIAIVAVCVYFGWWKRRL